MFLNFINLFTDIGKFLDKMIEDSKAYVGHEDIPFKVHGTAKQKDVKTVEGEKVMNTGKIQLISLQLGIGYNSCMNNQITIIFLCVNLIFSWMVGTSSSNTAYCNSTTTNGNITSTPLQSSSTSIHNILAFEISWI